LQSFKNRVNTKLKLIIKNTHTHIYNTLPTSQALIKISKTRIDGRWMNGFKNSSSSTDDELFSYHPGSSECGSLWAPERRVGRTVGQTDDALLLPLSTLQLRGSDGVCHASLFLNRQTRGRQFGRRWNWQSLLASATTIHDANRHLFVGAVTFLGGISLLVLAQIVARCRSCCLHR
jgi:hypothetical protein